PCPPSHRSESDPRSQATPSGTDNVWATPPTPSTARTVTQAVAAPAPSPESQLPGGDEGIDRVPRSLEGRAAALVAVDHGQDPEHPPPFRCDDAGRLLRGAAGRDHVLHDDDAGAGCEAPLDPLLRAVVLRLLTDGEGVERGSARVGRGGDGVGNRI